MRMRTIIAAIAASGIILSGCGGSDEASQPTTPVGTTETTQTQPVLSDEEQIRAIEDQYLTLAREGKGKEACALRSPDGKRAYVNKNADPDTLGTTCEEIIENQAARARALVKDYSWKTEDIQVNGNKATAVSIISATLIEGDRRETLRQAVIYEKINGKWYVGRSVE